MKTYKQILDDVANQEGHADWLTAQFRLNSTSLELLHQRAAILYAQQALELAAERVKLTYGDTAEFPEVDRDSILKLKDELK